MSSPLCGTGIFANDVLCEVINNLDNLIATAAAAQADAEQALADLKTSTETQVASIAGIDYSANTTGVNKSYVAPTQVVLPDPTTDALITDATIQSIFDKAAGNLAQVSVKDERDAQYKYSSMGIGMLNASLQKRIDEAEQNTNERISSAALENAIQEGQWKREDAKDIYSLQTEAFANAVRSEAERRGWSEMEIRDILEQADKVTLYAIEKTKLILDITRQTDEAVAQLTVGLTQAIYAAADYNLGGSGAQTINTNIAQ